MIRLYDTMARRKLDFVPADPKRITMYVCGPTVYGRAHIGNARPAVVFDTLARLIRHVHPDHQLIYARNVTDVDDKIIASAAEEGVEPSVITQRFERYYLEDMGALGVAPPDIAPHATQDIPAMVAMIAELVASGNAYAAEGHVLFSVASDPEYGSFSRRDREAMIAGARVEIAPYKRDPADFVLWKPSEPHVIGWESPWGRGRPGWHIECSAMIAKHLGQTIDIHGGGLDLIFPHHENEIAQSRCAHGGAPLARHWVHNGFVDVGAEKMSKSLGNVITPEELLKTHKGETLRLALLSAHYRSPLPWTETLIAQSKGRLDRWYRAKANMRFLRDPKLSSRFLAKLANDLNTPDALSIIDELASAALQTREMAGKLSGDEASKLKRKAGRAARKMVACAELVGLLRHTSSEWFQDPIVGNLNVTESPDTLEASGTLAHTRDSIDRLVAARNAAKAARDFATADRIRDELKAAGILLEDGPSETTWRRA